MKVLTGPHGRVVQHAVSLSRLPVFGEYVRQGNEWYQVKRVMHSTDGEGMAGEVYVIPIVDPTRTPLELYEWLEPGP